MMDLESRSASERDALEEKNNRLLKEIEGLKSTLKVKPNIQNNDRVVQPCVEFEGSETLVKTHEVKSGSPNKLVNVGEENCGSSDAVDDSNGKDYEQIKEKTLRSRNSYSLSISAATQQCVDPTKDKIFSILNQSSCLNLEPIPMNLKIQKMSLSING